MIGIKVKPAGLIYLVKSKWFARIFFKSKTNTEIPGVACFKSTIEPVGTTIVTIVIRRIITALIFQYVEMPKDEIFVFLVNDLLNQWQVVILIFDECHKW